MRIFRNVFLLFFCPVVSIASAQEMISAPEPQPGVITGTITDADGAWVPNAVIVLDSSNPSDHRTATSDGNGLFALSGVRTAAPVHIMVTAQGFAAWTSTELTLTPGQSLELPEIKLTVGALETTVTAVFAEQFALEQVKAEEKQRVLGVIPNFYVVYDHNAVPLTKTLKFRLALKASTDVATISGVAAFAGINQAADRFAFGQGAQGYGKRFGAIYADGFSDIMVGGAILPSLLHQDPRYFYQGTGTIKSRALHAISAPFICKGDNGKWQFNYSSIGGDLASGAISNLYYPSSNRGAGLVFQTSLTTTAGRMLTTLAQEFLLKKFTTQAPQP